MGLDDYRPRALDYFGFPEVSELGDYAGNFADMNDFVGDGNYGHGGEY